MNFTNLSTIFLAVTIASNMSCTTANGSNANGGVNKRAALSKANAVTQAPTGSSSTSLVNPQTPTAKSTEPAKVQPQFQNEFARELVKAGPHSEGWALFSDSSMGHNGQRWIIKSTESKKVTLCVILQQDKECKVTILTDKQFEAIIPALKKGEKLSHILPASYDALTFEFLHARNSSPQTERVVFISSDKPFPADYEAVIKAFN